MKKLFIVTVVIFSSISVNAQFESGRLTAAGLTCAMCTKAIHNALQKVSVIENVDADIQNSEFVLTFRKGSSVDPDALKKAVEDAGFSVSVLKLTGDFPNINIRNDSHIMLGGKTFHFLN